MKIKDVATGVIYATGRGYVVHADPRVLVDTTRAVQKRLAHWASRSSTDAFTLDADAKGAAAQYLSFAGSIHDLEEHLPALQKFTIDDFIGTIADADAKLPAGIRLETLSSSAIIATWPDWIAEQEREQLSRDEADERRAVVVARVGRNADALRRALKSRGVATDDEAMRIATHEPRVTLSHEALATLLGVELER